MKWKSLTQADREAVLASLPGATDGFLKGWGWQQFAEAIEALCREKNGQDEGPEAEFDVIADDMPQASAAGPRAQALAEARNYALQYLDDYPAVRIEEVRRVVVERYVRT